MSSEVHPFTPAWPIRWKYGTASCNTLGGMIAPAEVVLPDGRNVSLLYSVPWLNEPEVLDAAIPGHQKRLRGAFPALPFGIAAEPRELTREWQIAKLRDPTLAPHGLSTNELWSLQTHNTHNVMSQFTYPQDSPVIHLRQRVQGLRNRRGLGITVGALTRQDVFLPYGHHFLLPVPEPPEVLAIRPARFQYGLTYPGIVEPNAMRTQPGARFTSLNKVPARHGGTTDLSTFPTDAPLEDLVQLCGSTGPIEVFYLNHKYGIRISWDTQVLPSCMLWYSWCGLADYPWRNSCKTLCIEPIASAFDLEPHASIEANPISGSGIATTVALKAMRPWQTRLSIEAFIQ